MEDRKVELEKINKMIAENMSGIKKKILVVSNKGGVGKSFVSINIAYYLSKTGRKVGILNADIHGPSVAKMLGFENKKAYVENGIILPVKITENLIGISMALFLENSDTPVIWRGPLKMIAIRQFLSEVKWGQLDYLIIDSPPGTGDEPLTICQFIPDLTGAIIVTTPQEVALNDSRKCITFLKQLSISVIGILENMSGFICPYCNREVDIFKSGGGEKASKEFNVPFLGKIPLDINIVKTSDEGKPFIKLFPDSDAARTIKKVCDLILEM